MKNLCKIFFLSLVLTMNAEAQSVTWSKWYDYGSDDNEGLDVIQTYDNGYAFLLTNFVPFDHSLTLLKTDFLGNIQWQRLFDRNNTGGAQLLGWGLEQSTDSGFIICGDSGGDSAFLIKTNNEGNLLWMRKFCPPGREARFFGISLTSDNGIIACGDVYSPYNGYIVKTDFNGNFEWDCLYGNRAYSIIQGSNNSYYFSDRDYLFKLNSKGKLIWQSPFIIGSGELGGNNIVEYSPEYIYVAGGLDSMALTKLDSSGSIIWQKGYYHESFGCGSMCLGKDGNFLLVGEIDTLLQFDGAVAKISPDGDLIFQKRLQLIQGGNYATVPYSVKSTSDSGYIMTGFTDYARFPWGDNALGIKTDSYCNAPLIAGISNSNSNSEVTFGLNQNYPNPFNPTTRIKFTLFQTGNVQLIIYDNTGRQVDMLINERMYAGNHSVSFNPSNKDLSSGVYFYKLIAGGYSEMRKMIYIK